MDKDKTLSQLEQRLLTQENQRERAEIRCGTALKVLTFRVRIGVKIRVWVRVRITVKDRARFFCYGYG
jgi:hypothetical protein